MDYDWLWEKYVTEELSQSEIANLLNCSQAAVYRRMKKFNIPTRPATTEAAVNAIRGKPLSEAKRKRLSEVNTGKTYDSEYKRKMAISCRASWNDARRKRYSEERTGERNQNWMGGKSFEPYCNKFNKSLKEEIRDRFGRRCFLCDEPENGKKLCVHHVDYNKRQGCGTKWNLIPLCASCHTKTITNRHYWFNLFVYHWCNKYMDFAFCGVL